MSDAAIPLGTRVPTVYFIDDSATMREVIKIAFRKESINVIACHDAASALAQFAESRPDAVITDVIMPDKDGYEVCRFVKQHPELGSTPVILMSGVVNRQVAEKAMEARADELMRKPFQPQELVTRVKSLLNPTAAGAATKESVSEPLRTVIPAPALSSLFAPPAPIAPTAAVPPPTLAERPAISLAPRAAVISRPSNPAAPNSAGGVPSSAELLKLRSEIRRLEMLVKKLQAELEGERQYCSELESQLRVQQETSS